MSSQTQKTGQEIVNNRPKYRLRAILEAVPYGDYKQVRNQILQDLKISNMTLHRWERIPEGAKTTIKDSDLLKLCKILQCSLSDLFHNGK